MSLTGIGAALRSRGRKVQDIHDLKLVTVALGKRVAVLEAISESSRDEIAALMCRLEKLEPPCPGARQVHKPRGNIYCVECRG